MQHYYPNSNSDSYLNLIKNLSDVCDLLDDNGFEGIPIAITDMATFLPRDVQYRENLVAESIIKNYIIGFTHWANLITWAQLSDWIDSAHGSQFEAGIISDENMEPWRIHNNYYKNLGFYSYKLMTQKLKNFESWNNNW